MQALLTPAEMREADRYTIEEVGIPAPVLMEHAALALVRRLRARYHGLLSRTRGWCLAGPGNNGGDALAAARLLYQGGCRGVRVALLTTPKELSPQAQQQYRVLTQLGVSVTETLPPEALESCDWILDGLFGVGLSRPLEGEALKWVAAVNRVAHKKWVVAVDIPSGLSGETGMPLGDAVRACETVTFGYLKRGLLTGAAADYVGKISLRFIQIPRFIPALRPGAVLYGREDARHLPPRKPSGHKGDYGQAYFFQGEPQTQGASLLACLAAFRTGAGLVTLVGESLPGPEARGRLPLEVMTGQWGASLFSQMKQAAVGVGPGFGTSDDKWRLLAQILETPWPLVLDADALTLLAQNPVEAQKILKARQGATVITPHPKEASRLLGIPTEEVQKNRFASAERLRDEWNAYVVLKGRGTLVACPGRPLVVVSAGDSGLSKGGAGDVLTGVLVALLAQGMEPRRALPLGTYLHGRASELLTEATGHSRSALAGEVAAQIPKAIAELVGRR